MGGMITIRIISPNQTNNGFFGYSYYTQYSTLADWQAAFGGAYEQNGVYSNPVFTSPATFDFTPNSPVLDNRGFDLISTGTVIKDFNYQTRIPPIGSWCSNFYSTG